MSSRYQRVASLGARRARARRSLVDLVVDVGDVVHERDVVAALPQPAGQPRENDERPRVADMRACIDRRPADVHADARRRLRQLDEPALEGAIEPHRPSAAPRPAGAPRYGPELRPSLGARQREPQRLRSPPTAFSSRTSSRPSTPLARSSAKRSSVGLRRLRNLDRPRAEDRLRQLARLDEIAGASERRSELRRRARRPGELLVRHRGDRVDREPAQPRQVEMDIVRRLPQLLEVAPHRHGGDAGRPQIGHGRDRAVPLGELLAVVAEQQAVMDVLGRLEPERRSRAPAAARCWRGGRRRGRRS